MNSFLNTAASFMLKGFLVGLTISASGVVHSCPTLSGRGNHLVVPIEGLFGDVLFGSPAKRLAANLGVAHIGFSHYNSDSYIADCVANWKKANPNGRVTLMGHSLGGGRANTVANALASRKIRIDNLVVFDGRQGHELTCGANSGASYSKPANVNRVVNFYQCGFMPGNTYKSGPGVENIRVYSRHVGIPSDPQVRARVAALLRSSAPTSASGSKSRSPQSIQGPRHQFPVRTVEHRQPEDGKNYICITSHREYRCTKSEVDEVNRQAALQ